MSDTALRKWEEPASAREKEMSVIGDERMSPPGGGRWEKRLSFT